MTAGTAGGWAPYSYIAAASANQDSQVVKGSPGTIGNLILCNLAAAVRYVKVYDSASAPTSSSTPIQRYALQANSTTEIPLGEGLTTSAGIAFRLTVNQADNDASAVTAGDVVVNITYL